jgi:hypothetical protein
LTTPADNLLRIERGHAGPEELAAITAVLLTRAAGEDTAGTVLAPPRPTPACWPRPERHAGYPGAHSWQK